MTKIEICNRALAVLGHDRMIEDFDGMTDGQYNDQSTEALRCRQFFNAALEDCLSEHNWDFAAVERTMGASACDGRGWVRIPLIHDAVRICTVVNECGKPLETRRTRDCMYVRSDGRQIVIRYVSRDVEISELPHKFTEALVYKLAALLAGPMFGDDRKTQNFMTLAAQKLSDAVTKETDETAFRGEWRNPFIAARR